MTNGSDFPALRDEHFKVPALADFDETARAVPHKPRILLLYGSLRERSYSRFLTFEAARLLERMGAETRIFHADGLPLPNAYTQPRSALIQSRSGDLRDGCSRLTRAHESLVAKARRYPFLGLRTQR